MRRYRNKPQFELTMFLISSSVSRDAAADSVRKNVNGSHKLVEMNTNGVNISRKASRSDTLLYF